MTPGDYIVFTLANDVDYERIGTVILRKTWTDIGSPQEDLWWVYFRYVAGDGSICNTDASFTSLHTNRLATGKEIFVAKLAGMI